jgi:hypothetical protein
MPLKSQWWWSIHHLFIYKKKWLLTYTTYPMCWWHDNRCFIQNYFINSRTLPTISTLIFYKEKIENNYAQGLDFCRSTYIDDSENKLIIRTLAQSHVYSFSKANLSHNFIMKTFIVYKYHVIFLELSHWEIKLSNSVSC